MWKWSLITVWMHTVSSSTLIMAHSHQINMAYAMNNSSIKHFISEHHTINIVYEQSTNHISLKIGLGVNVKSPTAQDVIRPIPGLISYAWVTRRWGLPFHAQNTVRWLALSKRSVEALRRHLNSLCAAVLRAAVFCSKIVASVIVTC